MSILHATVVLIRESAWLAATLAVLICQGPAAAKRRFEIPSPSAAFTQQGDK